MYEKTNRSTTTLSATQSEIFAVMKEKNELSFVSFLCFLYTVFIHCFHHSYLLLLFKVIYLKMLKGLFELILAACCISFSRSSCPSNEYLECASEGNSCYIPSNIDQGYISYGVSGRYTLVPFTNSADSSLTIRCDNDFGDVYYGRTKYCCYIDTQIIYIT